MRFKVVDFLRDTSGLVDLSEVQCVLHVESLVTFPCLDLVGGLGRFYYGGRIRGHQTEYACRSNARTHGHPIKHSPCGGSKNNRQSARLDGIVSG
jgi:hypothetical protein